MSCEIKRRTSKETVVFYNERFSSGYLDEWPLDQMNRILEIIKSLNLPETGDALDFGCGNGIFTGILKQSLPRWNVYGVDISFIAIANAKKRYSNCEFFLTADLDSSGKTFDLIFSHHVLEHVEDVSQALFDIHCHLKKQARSLHVLPCGNSGSFEYNLCMQIINGIEIDSENRFIFEDKSHLRRLTTEQMNNFAIQYDSQLVFAYYSNQFFGALNWVTLSSPLFILDMCNPRRAKNKASALKLACLLAVLLFVKFLRFPANIIDYKRSKFERYKYYILFILFLVQYPVSKLTNIYLKHMCDWEWRKERNKKNGSEMYLCYKRN